jgi:hypothetical protein
MNTERPTEQELRGMTVNERLVACGVIDKWDAAVLKRKREAMSAILKSVAMTDDQTASTTDAVLKNPAMYGFQLTTKS